MEKTTVYLPAALKLALERTARQEGRSEAELIREGVEHVTSRRAVREPTAPLFSSDGPDYATGLDEYMEGFGER
jgi:Ribbon-helix-helix protein, copG family